VAPAGPGKKLCGAKTPGGRYPTCHNVAGKGTDHKGVGRCSRHLGNTESHVKAAEVELVEAEAVRQLRAEGYAPAINPVEELLKLGAEVTALKDVLRSRVADLADPEWVTRNKLNVEDVRAIVSAYERALDRCERTLTNMLKLELEARRVKLSETQGALLEQAIRGILTDLGVADRREVPAVVRRHLTLIAASG
jgi:hypothetical protein